MTPEAVQCLIGWQCCITSHQQDCISSQHDSPVRLSDYDCLCLRHHDDILSGLSARLHALNISKVLLLGGLDPHHSCHSQSCHADADDKSCHTKGHQQPAAKEGSTFWDALCSCSSKELIDCRPQLHYTSAHT